MATFNPNTEYAPTTVDTNYVADLTTTPSTEFPAKGGIYNPAVLGAGHLVHVHQSEGDPVLLTFSKAWTGVMDPNNAGAFTSHTSVDQGIAYWMNPASGELVPAVDRAGPPGQLYASVPGFQLIAGATHGGMVHYLGTVSGSPLLLHYRTASGVLSFVGSEWINPAYPFDGNTAMLAVTWDRGLVSSGDGLYIFGSDTTGSVYVQKMLYSSMGFPRYLSRTGWELDGSQARPMIVMGGAPLKSFGPVSAARHYDDWYLSVVTSGTRTARFYRARHPLGIWFALGKVVTLPDTNSAVRFQTVPVNPAFTTIADQPDVVAGLPFTYTVESSTALRTSWDVLPVPRGRI